MTPLVQLHAKLKETGTIVGHRISYPDNDTDMWERVDTRLPVCPKCGIRTDFFATNPDYKVKKRYKPGYAPELAVTGKTGLAATYDGQTIASLAFRNWCMEQGYVGLEFREFPRDPYHFHLIANNIVPFDGEISGSTFINYCSECGNYEAVGGGLDIVKVSTPLPDGFYRTDLLFACGREKHPLLIVGPETKAKLRAAKIEGLDFHPVYASPPDVERKGLNIQVVDHIPSVKELFQG